MSSEASGRDASRSDYAHKARRAAEGAARRAAAPLLAVRQQKLDLDSARAQLQATDQALEQARAEIARLQDQLLDAARNADRRRAVDAVERCIDQQAAAQDDLTAPELRDLALAVADLDVNGAPGVVVLLAGDSTANAAIRSVLAAAISAERDVVDAAEPEQLDLDEPVALAYLAAAAYDGTLAALQRVAPLLVSGGRIVVDGYAGSAEVHSAVDEYFRDRRMDFRFEQHSGRHVVRR